MFQYLLIFSILTIFMGLNKGFLFSLSGRDRKPVFVISLSLLWILASFRTEIVGNDTGEYIRIFKESGNMLADGSTRFEFGYVYFNYLVSQITSQPRFFFIVTNIFIFFTYGHFIWKYSQRPKLALVLFFLIVFGNIVNILRQIIAICILLYGIEALLENKRIRFVFLVLFATLFHTTAILFLVIFPLYVYHVRVDRRILILFAIISISSYVVFASLLSIAFSYLPMYEYYSLGKYFEGGMRVASVVKVLFSVLVISLGYIAYTKYATSQWKNSIEGRRYNLLLLLELVAVVINVMSLRVNLIDRLGLYFTALSFVLISNAIQLLPVKNRRFVTLLILFVYISYSCITILYRPDWNRVYPIELSLLL